MSTVFSEKDDFELNNEGQKEVELEAINLGYDGLSMTGVEFFANIEGQDGVKFTWRLPPKGVYI